MGGVVVEVATEPLGRWRVEIPDSAQVCWDEWDQHAWGLTLWYLVKFGDISAWRNPKGWTTVYHGVYKEENRRVVGEALTHLTALARVGIK